MGDHYSTGFLRQLIRTIRIINPKGSYACRLENYHESRFGPIFAASAVQVEPHSSWDYRHLPCTMTVYPCCWSYCFNLPDWVQKSSWWSLVGYCTSDSKMDCKDTQFWLFKGIFWVQYKLRSILWHDVDKNNINMSLLLWVLQWHCEISSSGVRSIWGRFVPFMFQVCSTMRPTSCHGLRSPDGSADLETFQSHSGRPVASPETSHCQLFYSLTEGTLGKDALAHSWPRGLRKYAFPLVSLLAQTLCKVRED